MMTIFRSLATILCAALFATPCPVAKAGGFAAMVSPPRFELEGKPGVRINQVVEISNGAPAPAHYRISTSDWTLADDGGPMFQDALQPGSCRSWVALQRKELVVPAGGHVRFRFEVNPPASAPVGECRFALMVAGDDELATTAEGAKFPISGRLAVIVYVQIGEAKPELEIVSARTAMVNGVRTPVLEVRNHGSAHGRLSGFLSGTDASGRKLEFAPSTLPILPNEVRQVALTPSAGGRNVSDVAYPVVIRGSLEWGDKREPFERSFD
jgi:hypothetical protein